MQASFGKYAYSKIAGYLIQTGLRPRGGVGKEFAVHVLLASRIDTKLPDLPCWDPRLTENKKIFDDLKLESGSAVDYTFPKIQFRSSRTVYNNSVQYHVLEFFYPDGLTPGKGKSLPDIKLRNTNDPTYKNDASKSRGTVAVTANGTNEAQLIALQAYQIQERASGIQVVSERCKNAGWLVQILAQNNKLNEETTKDCDLAFTVNGAAYSCSPDKQGMRFLAFEERYGLALSIPLTPVDVMCERDEPTVGRLPVEAIIQQFTAGGMLRSWSAEEKLGDLDQAVEICTVVSETSAARLFDWKAPRQRG